MDRLRADMMAPEVARVIAQDGADARTLNVTKTPEYFVYTCETRFAGWMCKNLSRTLSASA